MKNAVKILMAVMAALMLISSAACSNKRPVKVVQGTSQAPVNKKPMATRAPTGQEILQNFSGDIKANLDGDTLVITAPDISYTIPCNKIQEATYMTEWDYSLDKQTEGVETEYAIYGKMQTEADEVYNMFIYKTTPVYIAVCFGDVEYVFNLTSVTATRELYEQIKEKI